MPYLPLPPSQPPPIIQTLPPEENSASSPSASTKNHVPPVEAQVSARTPSAVVNPPASAILGSPSAQTSPNLGFQKQLSSGDLDTTPNRTSSAPASDVGVASGSSKNRGTVPRQAPPTHFSELGHVSSNDNLVAQTPKEPSPPAKLKTSNLSTPEDSQQVLATEESQNLQSTPDRDTATSTNLLQHYGFDRGELTAEQLTDQWLQAYPSDWIRSALIEALYQGRYKAASVERILAAWQRRGQPLYHFNQEFEHLVAPSSASLLEPVAQSSPPGNVNDDNEEPLELYADRQEYDEVRQIFTAVGNVLLRFREAVLRADQLQVNVRTQVATATGNISLTRGEQRLQGDRLEYNYVQNRGSFLNARGEIYIPTISTDISTAAPTDELSSAVDDIFGDQPLTEQIQENQPRQVRATDEIQRLRFEAERIEFTAGGWQARNIRITNDPFSPPELEVRADEARLTRVSELEDRVEATRPRLVLDQGLSLPILRSKAVISRQVQDPVAFQFGFDDDRGGFFVGRTFQPLLTDQSSLTITPQFFLQRALGEGNFNVFDPDHYGLNVRLNSDLDPLTSLTGTAKLTSLDPTEIGDNLRANLRLQRPVGTHRLAVEYAYRERVYNGSLGFQNVQSSLGAVLTSPTFSLGNTGIELDYQVGTQYITARTDQSGLADPASLGRFQASASLRRGFYLWQGQGLPATATEGLRYTPEPVVPYLRLFTRLTGVANAYTNGDTQQTLLGRVGLQGQFGRFSRPFLDYTGFDISYSQTGLLGLSPFIFDRVTDFKVLSAGIVQQIYGPIRIGVRTSMNLDTGNQFDTEFLLDYSRRTYGVSLRYNSSRQVGSINFRLSGFNWTGGSEAFSEPEDRSLEEGIQTNND